jgi:hypothetical protein
VLATCVLAACATTQSPERQRRIPDCLAGCRVNDESPRTAPFDQNAGGPSRQTRACEQQCESTKFAIPVWSTTRLVGWGHLPGSRGRSLDRIEM